MLWNYVQISKCHGQCSALDAERTVNQKQFVSIALDDYCENAQNIMSSLEKSFRDWLEKALEGLERLPEFPV